jgi:hypothetical protein
MKTKVAIKNNEIAVLTMDKLQKPDFLIICRSAQAGHPEHLLPGELSK